MKIMFIHKNCHPFIPTVFFLATTTFAMLVTCLLYVPEIKYSFMINIIFFYIITKYIHVPIHKLESEWIHFLSNLLVLTAQRIN